MPNVEISNDDLFELASLVYRRWCEEFDYLKLVKAERDDGSPDWAEFHQRRLTAHTEHEAKWAAFRNRMVALMPKPVL